MKSKKVFIVASFVLMFCLASNPGGATLVTSLPGGTVIPMPSVNYFGAGPQTFGPGITWTSTNDSYQRGRSVFGYSGQYGFPVNGYWDSIIMAGLNASTDIYGVTDTMTFAFSTPAQAVGGFLNYVPGSSHPTTIAVYDANHTLIESYNLAFLTGGGGNTGSFYGFQETTPIYYFTLTDNYVGITNLTVQENAVPLPGAVWLLGSGLVGLAGLGRRKFNKS